MIPIVVGLAVGAVIWFAFVRPRQRRRFEKEMRDLYKLRDDR